MAPPRLIQRSDKWTKDWRTVNEVIAAQTRISGAQDRLVMAVEEVRRRQLLNAATRMFPFRVYRAGDWRTFRVRAGRIGNTVVSGTDAVSDPDDRAAGTSGDIEVPDETAAYHIWLEYILPYDEDIESPVATIKHSASPGTVVAGDIYSGDWPNFPYTCTVDDRVCVLIATIDTDTGHASSTAYLRQYIRMDLPDIRPVCALVDGEEKVIHVWCQGRPVTATIALPQNIVTGADSQGTIVAGADSEGTIVTP